MSEYEKYVKIVYQSEPIGKEKIILYLTAFDLEAFKKDEALEKIPTKQVAKVIDLPQVLYDDNSCITMQRNRYEQEMFRTIIEKFIVETYDEQLRKMKDCIEQLRKIKIVPMEYSTEQNAKNITNSDDVHCNIVEGNIVNCNDVYCNEIKGNVVNCDRIIYKKDGDKNAKARSN